MRTSMFSSPRLIETRPSCGARRSAMSSPPMILSRLVTAAACEPAIEVSSRMTPSTRTRTKRRRCCGVKWMSEAPRSSAFEMARLMKTTAGVSCSRSSTVASSLVSCASVTTSSISTTLVVDALDRELDRVGGGDADTHRHAEREPEVVREHDVRRVGDGDEDVAVLEEAHRDAPVAAGKVLGEQQRCFGLDILMSSSRYSSSCCSARMRVTVAARDAIPSSTRISPSRCSGVARFSASAASSCSG